jgi:hypothetical protein
VSWRFPTEAPIRGELEHGIFLESLIAWLIFSSSPLDLPLDGEADDRLRN